MPDTPTVSFPEFIVHSQLILNTIVGLILAMNAFNEITYLNYIANVARKTSH